MERLNDVNHIERIVRSGDGEGDSEDEFFDCKEVPEDLRSLTKWNSMELVPDQENDYSGKMNLFFVIYSSTTYYSPMCSHQNFRLSEHAFDN